MGMIFMVLVVAAPFAEIINIQGSAGCDHVPGNLKGGTMIVVEDAKDKVGKKITVTVSKVIQTDAGKMVFCDL